MKYWHRQQKQAGDTIVEVLIAVVIISTVLTSAFLVARKSTQAVRDSQEHAEMTQTLQGQVELVRSLALQEPDDTTGVFDTSPRYFCIGTNSANPATYRLPVPQPQLTDSRLDDDTRYASSCKGLQGFYKIAIRYDSANKVFTFIGSWDRIGGGTNSEQMSYRVYPGQSMIP